MAGAVAAPAEEEEEEKEEEEEEINMFESSAEIES